MHLTSRLFLVCLLCLALPACAAEPSSEAAESEGTSAGGEVTLESEDQKTLYALGQMMARNLGPFSLSDEDMRYVVAGLEDGVAGDTSKVNLQEYGPKIQQLGQQRMSAAAEGEKQAAATFIDEQAAQEGATKTESGLVFQQLTEGTGESPGATSKVKVHYHGTLRDGSVFDSSVDRGQPAEFGLNQVVPCWTEALQMMKVGGKARIVCPSDLAYGDQGRPPTIPPGAALVFEVELLEITG